MCSTFLIPVVQVYYPKSNEAAKPNADGTPAPITRPSSFIQLSASVVRSPTPPSPFSIRLQSSPLITSITESVAGQGGQVGHHLHLDGGGLLLNFNKDQATVTVSYEGRKSKLISEDVKYAAPNLDASNLDEGTSIELSDSQHLSEFELRCVIGTRPLDFQVQLNQAQIVAGTSTQFRDSNVLRLITVKGEHIIHIRRIVYNFRYLDVPYYSWIGRLDRKRGQSDLEMDLRPPPERQADFYEIELNNPSIPFMHDIPGGLRVGMAITVVGRMIKDGVVFTINMKASTHPDSNIDFHFNVRLNQGAIVCNNRTAGHWVSEERTEVGRRFAPEAEFMLKFVVEEERFVIYASNPDTIDCDLDFLLSFEHRLLPLNTIRALQIQGEVQIQSIVFGISETEEEVMEIIG